MGKIHAVRKTHKPKSSTLKSPHQLPTKSLLPFPFDQSSPEFEIYRQKWSETQYTNLYNWVMINDEALNLFETLPKHPLGKLLSEPELPEFVTLVGDDNDARAAIFRPTILPKAGKTTMTETGIVSAAPVFDIYLIDDKNDKPEVVGILIFGTSTNVFYDANGKLQTKEPELAVWQAYPQKYIDHFWVENCQDTLKVVETLAKYNFGFLKSLYIKTPGKVAAHWRKVKPSAKNGGKTRIWTQAYFR